MCKNYDSINMLLLLQKHLHVISDNSLCLQFCTEYMCRGSSVCQCLESAQRGLIQKALEITFLSSEQGRDLFQVRGISCKSQNSVANITRNQSIFNRVDVSNFRVSSEERHERNYKDLD